MINNDILRRVRYLFGYDEAKTIALFKLTDYDVKKATLSTWLKNEEDASFVEITDKELATFLNGLIIEKRGKREGPAPIAEDPLSNNMILKKLKIALNLTTDDVLELFASVDTKVYKNELSAFFRNPKHPAYRNCMEQYLRRFINALEKKYKNKKA